MRWTSLGRGSWLVETGAVRVVIDPLFAPPCAGRELWPPRTCAIDALQPDFVLVTSASAAHEPSLREIAARDPGVVAIACEGALAACRAAGFESANTAPMRARIDIEGAAIATTARGEGRGDFGVLVSDADGIVWAPGAIDGVDRARDEWTLAREALGDPGAALGALLWSVADFETAPGEGFPRSRYVAALDAAAALTPRAVVTACAGVRAADPVIAREIECVPVARAVRDLRARCPRVPVYPARPGDAIELAGKRAAFEPGAGVALVRSVPGAAIHDPWPALAPGSDWRADNAAVLAIVDRALPDALAAAAAQFAPGTVLALRVVSRAGAHIEREYVAQSTGVQVQHEAGADADAFVAIAAGALLALVAGTARWDEVCARGAVRVVDRSLDVRAVGARAATYDPLFVRYLAPR